MRNAAANVESILNLIQFAARASQDWGGTKLGLEGASYGRIGVGLAGAWGNAGVREPLTDLADESDLRDTW